jgi:hypothetical protein
MRHKKIMKNRPNQDSDFECNKSDVKFVLCEFSIGIEAAQMTVVLTILLFSYIAQTIFKLSKRDFTLVVSAFIVGVVVPMIIENNLWNKPLWN